MAADAFGGRYAARRLADFHGVSRVCDYEAYDRGPGLHRLVLDQKRGNRSYSRDVDVIEGKRTVWKVYIDELDWEYDVRVFYD